MKNQLKTLLLLGTLSTLLVGAGAIVGPGWAYGALAVAVVLNAGAYFFSDRVVLAMHGARELSPLEAPQLHAVVEELARNAGIPKPRVMRLSDAGANAFATGRTPSRGVVAVTDGLLRILDERELRAVLAHELAHIKNRDILVSSIAAVLAAALTWLAHGAQAMALFGHDEGEERGGGLLVALVAPFAGILLQLGVSRSREYLADAEGSRISGDPLALASALEKLELTGQEAPVESEPATSSLFIVNPLAGARGVLSLLSTHPRTAERVRRLRRMAIATHGPAAAPRMFAGAMR